MKPLIFLLPIIFLHYIVNAQNLADYRLEGGLSIGDRYMDMGEINYQYNSLGFGNPQTSTSTDRYSYKGMVKPFHNTGTLSGFLTWRPFKNNGLTLSLQYDYLLAASRKITVTHIYDVDIMDGNTNTVIGIDTVKDIYPENSTIRIQTGNLILGYDFGYRKVLFNVAAGMSYNYFIMAGSASQTSYQSQEPFKSLPPEIYAESYGVYAKANGLGFIARISASYELTKRLSAIVQFTTHAAALTLYDIPYYHQVVWYQRSIPITDTYSINIVDYLSAELSGVQISGGLIFRIF